MSSKVIVYVLMASFGTFLQALLRAVGLRRPHIGKEWVRPQNAITRTIEADLRRMLAPAAQPVVAAPPEQPLAPAAEVPTQAVTLADEPDAEETKKAGRAA